MIKPVELDHEILAIMEEKCKELDYNYKYLPSGAGHDSLEIGQVLSTAMIFVPSKDGRSHCMEEFTKYSDLAKATEVMVGLLTKLTGE